MQMQRCSKLLMLKRESQQKGKPRYFYARLYKAFKLRIRTQQELDEHRRGGHARYSPDCPECKRGAAKQRPRERLFTRQGGELSIDISGPFTKGVPVTDRNVGEHQWPRYLLVGAFVPFGEKEVKARYEQ